MVELSEIHNQDAFIIATDCAFRIFSVTPYQLLSKQNFQGGFRLAYLAEGTDLILLVPTGVNQKHKSNSLYIWENNKQEFIEKKAYDEVIQSVAFSNKMCIVPQSTFISCISLDNGTSFQIPTLLNPLMLFSVSFLPEFCIASPSIEKGKTQIQWLICYSDFEVNKYDKICLINIQCNNSGIQAIKLTSDGKQVATASERGTIIRLFCTKSGQILNEFRRGTISAKINGLQFSNDSYYLICYSDKQTIHVYKTLEKYIKSYYSMVCSAVSNSRDEWSFAQFNLNDHDNFHIIVSIYEDCIHIINKNGKYLKALIQAQGGILYLQEGVIIK